MQKQPQTSTGARVIKYQGTAEAVEARLRTLDQGQRFLGAVYARQKNGQRQTTVYAEIV